MNKLLLLSASLIGPLCAYTQGDCPPRTACTSSMTGSCTVSHDNDLTGVAAGCLSTEANKTSWLSLCFSTSGTIKFSITPGGAANNDMDFAVWGPVVTCPPTLAPIRCSVAPVILSKVTGLSSTLNLPQIDLVDDLLTGNGWANDLTVTAGQCYLMCISNYGNGNNSWTLNFTGTTATFSCVALGVELLYFEGAEKSVGNVLSWKTLSEQNNNYFTIERSINAKDWQKVTDVFGAGTTLQEQEYSYSDTQFEAGKINYYRLSQTDLNGQVTTFSSLASIDNTHTERIISHCVNQLGQTVLPTEPGLVIIHYADGSVVKQLNP